MDFRQLIVSLAIGATATVCLAQPNRILSKIDNSKTFSLPGRVHPLATARNDRGAVDSSFPLPYITMRFAPTAAQQTALQQLLHDQQNPASPSYRKWLTPEQYADRFGVSSRDAAQIVDWLQAQGFKVNPVSRSRTFLTFSGTAGRVGSAFGATIHRYQVDGAMHYANSTDLTVPAALSPLVAGFHGLHDFRAKPILVNARPQWTLFNDSFFALAPDDFAAIYDIAPLYAAGIDGAGQQIAIVGQSELYNSGSDITSFWNTFGITSAQLVQTLVPGSRNPGIVPRWVDEASLDIEWASAVARGATIEFVYSEDDWDAATYIVDNVVAPVLSMSYAECELYDLIDMPSLRQTVQQANAQGITWLGATGDTGAAACDPQGTPEAEGGLGVNQPASIPEVTAVGGSELSEDPVYWNSTNTATYESAKGYIPETAWNDSVAAGGLEASGGGVSMYFPQPSWQTSGGVPNDGWRHLPDVSFNASGVPYYVYCSSPFCAYSESNIEYVGGTSAATPTMAGVVALLNQYLNTNGLGNINPVFYRLAQIAPNAFHDITSGSNIVPCASGSPGCVNGQEGYSAGPGYDSVTGLGSVDVNNLVHAWTSAAPTGPVIVPSLDQNPVYQGYPERCGTSTQWNFYLTVAEDGGFATTLTGLSIGGTDYSSQIASIFGSPAIPARGSISGCFSVSSVNAPANETFTFSGGSGGSAWSTSLTVSFQGPQTPISVGGASNAASGQQAFAPGMIISVYGTAFATLTEAATVTPLPEYMVGFEASICPVNCNTAPVGYIVPLYYVGPNQANMQIPYEVSGAVDLRFGNPYQNTDYFFTVSPAAPGIFTLEDGSQNVVPVQTVSAGGIATVYVTGVGQVTPSVPDGFTPSGTQAPEPRQAVTVTVGGVAAPAALYAGIPSWSVGVLQINFTIPSGVPAGRQPVVVTIGTTPSPAAYITIQ
jgi:uncharacterized protein (TIGR03437 family)